MSRFTKFLLVATPLVLFGAAVKSMMPELRGYLRSEEM